MIDLNLVAQVQEQLKKIQAYDPDAIAREAELGSQLAFSQQVPQIQYVVDVFKNFDADDLSGLPKGYLVQIKKEMDKFQQVYSRFMTFNPQSDPSNSRPDIIGQLERYTNALLEQLAPVITYHKSVVRTLDEKLNDERSRLERVFNERKSEIEADLDAYKLILKQREELLEKQFKEDNERLVQKEEDLDSALERLHDVEAEFKSITLNMQEQAAKSGVTKEASYFGDAAKEYENNALIWQFIVIILSVSIIAAVILSFIYMKPPEKIEHVIHFISSKLVVFGTLFFVLGVSVKSYTSNMHNKVVNFHRRNALLSYMALVGGATHPTLKDRVLEHAAVCIYTHQDTGYLKGSNSSANSVVEIMPKAAFEGKVVDSL